MLGWGVGQVLEMNVSLCLNQPKSSGTPPAPPARTGQLIPRKVQSVKPVKFSDADGNDAWKEEGSGVRKKEDSLYHATVWVMCAGTGDNSQRILFSELT
jgi:hypothetical protein